MKTKSKAETKLKCFLCNPNWWPAEEIGSDFSLFIAEEQAPS